MPWLLDEDAALKLALQGIRVTDYNAPPGGRPVAVRYRSPEDEVAKYTPPVIIIEMPRLEMAYDRMHSGYTKFGVYCPEGYTPWWPDNADSYRPEQSPYWSFFPVAYNITYQISVYTRINRDHMEVILARLEAQDKLGRFSVLNIPQDRTFRRITRLSGPVREYEKDERGQRLFKSTYLIRVPTELVPELVRPPLADTVNGTIWTGRYAKLDFSPYYNESDVTSSEVAASFGILGVRGATQWNTDSEQT